MDETTTISTHTCQACGTEYRSFAAYTRQDACYAARQAAKFTAPDAFTADDAEDLPRSKHYGNARVESIDFTPGQGTVQTSNQYGTFDNHAPTEKQVAFIKRLADERGLEVDPTWIRTKSRCSTEIDRIIKLPVTVVTTVNKASEKQLALITKLWAERMAGDMIFQTTLDGYDKKTASALIDTLFGMPKLPKPVDPTAYEPTKGDVHVIDGEYFRIHQSQATGRFYAAHFDGHRFEYERGAIAKCTAANKCTAEQAAAFGHLHHQCVFCARQLDTPESTAVGYGPVCAGHHGLPWGG